MASETENITINLGYADLVVLGAVQARKSKRR
jgi:hypothetical protein